MFRNEKYHGKEALPAGRMPGAARHQGNLRAESGRRGQQERRNRQTWENSPEEISLYEELDAYCLNGCTLRLNGRRARPDQVVRACFRERDSYMRDFVLQSEKVEEICFNKVR